jgi:hypothetical protein
MVLDWPRCPLGHVSPSLPHTEDLLVLRAAPGNGCLTPGVISNAHQQQPASLELLISNAHQQQPASLELLPHWSCCPPAGAEAALGVAAPAALVAGSCSFCRCSRCELTS